MIAAARYQRFAAELGRRGVFTRRGGAGVPMPSGCVAEVRREGGRSALLYGQHPPTVVDQVRHEFLRLQPHRRLPR